MSVVVPFCGDKKRDHHRQPVRRIHTYRPSGNTTRISGGAAKFDKCRCPYAWISECLIFRLDSPDLGKCLSAKHDDGQLKQLVDDRNPQQLREVCEEGGAGRLRLDACRYALSAAQAELDLIEKEIAAHTRSVRGAEPDCP